jgi:hypothetical protein
MQRMMVYGGKSDFAAIDALVLRLRVRTGCWEKHTGDALSAGKNLMENSLKVQLNDGE